jgi:hypothetical protein
MDPVVLVPGEYDIRSVPEFKPSGCFSFGGKVIAIVDLAE